MFVRAFRCVKISLASEETQRWKDHPSYRDAIRDTYAATKSGYQIIVMGCGSDDEDDYELESWVA